MCANVFRFTRLHQQDLFSQGYSYTGLLLHLSLLLQVVGHLLLPQFGVSLLLSEFCQIIDSWTVTPGAQIMMLTVAFTFSGLTRLVCGMMGQQLPVRPYRSACLDGLDIVEGHSPWMKFVWHEGQKGVKRMAHLPN